MNGAQAFWRVLRDNGIPYVFGLPGSTEAALLDALVGQEGYPQYILTVHENVAVGMADGYARAGGRPGVASVHTSVGAFNALCGLYNAWRDGTPLVLVAGHKDSRLLRREGFCALPDLPDVPRQFTKHSWQTLQPEEVGPDVRRALQLAASPPAGPVFLAIPEDFLRAETGEPADQTPVLPVPGVPRPPAESVAAAATLLAEARRPLILAGREVARAGAMKLLVELAEKLAAPVVREPGQAFVNLAFPQDHRQYMGPYNSTMAAQEGVDVILAAGAIVFLEFDLADAPRLPAGAGLIHLHPDPREVGRLYPARVGLVGDVAAGLREVLQRLQETHYQAPAERRQWLDRLAGRRAPGAEEAAQAVEQDNGCPTPESLALALVDTLSPETVIVDEGIRSARALHRFYSFTVPGTYHRSSGGGLGWGLPTALGVKLACPERPVVAFLGDGACLFGLQALWTAAHYRIPVLVIVCHNRGYRAVKAALQNLAGKAAAAGIYPGTAINEPAVDFVRTAEGFGVPAYRASTGRELPSVLAKAFREAQSAPRLLEVALPAI